MVANPCFGVLEALSKNKKQLGLQKKPESLPHSPRNKGTEKRDRSQIPNLGSFRFLSIPGRREITAKESEGRVKRLKVWRGFPHLGSRTQPKPIPMPSAYHLYG